MFGRHGLKLKCYTQNLNNKTMKPIDVNTGTFSIENKLIPIITTISIEEQKDWLHSGGTLIELIELIQNN